MSHTHLHPTILPQQCLVNGINWDFDIELADTLPYEKPEGAPLTTPVLPLGLRLLVLCL